MFKIELLFCDSVVEADRLARKNNLSIEVIEKCSDAGGWPIICFSGEYNDIIRFIVNDYDPESDESYKDYFDEIIEI